MPENVNLNPIHWKTGCCGKKGLFFVNTDDDVNRSIKTAYTAGYILETVPHSTRLSLESCDCFPRPRIAEDPESIDRMAFTHF